ncbi:MAG: hypothetical protein ACK4F4_07230 [Hylemonella sp.]|uniref:hypothetical protein n=1 Tax=Hylemonella sp. TaxID=2066020 RepID=UPI00391D62EC
MTAEELLHLVAGYAAWLQPLEPAVRLLLAMTWLEICGAALGVLGTALLAFNGRWAGWGFVAYLGSNAAWIWFAWQHGHAGLVLQQVVFTVFALVGVWKWLVVPAWQRLGDWLDTKLDWGDPL